MDNTIEIMKEARKAGMQTACLMFGAFLVVYFLFGYYIYKSYSNAPTNYVEANKDNEIGNNIINQGGK